MAASLCEGFLKLGETSRVGSLLDLVKMCPCEQQLLFLEMLQQHLHRDFISLLPEHLVECVLSYLTAFDAINCTLVSKNWSKVVGGCSAFWLQRAQELGLNAIFISSQLKVNSSRGVKELCAAAVTHQGYIRSLTSHSIMISKSPSSVTATYQYAGNGLALRYKELNGEAQVVVERIVTPHSVVEIATFSVDSFSSRIKWVSSSGSYVLWKQLDGKWSGCDTTGLSLDLEQWVDEPVSQGFHSISFCHQCHLIAILSEAEDDMEVWDLQVVKLQRGKSTVRKMVYPLPLDRVQGALEKRRHFLGGDVTLLSDSEKTDSNGFCQSHHVLLQVDSKLVLHCLKSMPVTDRVLLINHLLPDAKLSRPLHIFSPHASELPLDVMDFQVSNRRPMFCYSSDYSHVALLHESYLYVWHLKTLEAESCADLLHYNLPSDCKCVALGSMYAVLASDIHGTCYVVVARTGEMLTQTSSLPYFNPGAQHSTRFMYYPPIDQSWLSSFQYADFWPLALMFDYFNSTENPSVEHELKALIGMQSHTKPSWGMPQLR
jgi:hypothetical protein